MVRIAGAVLLALVVIQFVAVEAANGPCHKFTALDQKGKKKTFNLDAITAATYTATDGQYQYEFKVCGNFNCPQVSEPTGACQETTAQGNNPMGAYPSPIVATYTTVGYPKGALTFQLGVQAGVTNPTQRTSTITIVCDPKAKTATQLKAISPPAGGNEPYLYQIYMNHKAGCPTGGLSAGSILLITLVVLAFVYFVGGFIFLRFVKHREGGDAIPNREFWADLPGLVKDGIMFVINKIRGTPSSYETVA